MTVEGDTRFVSANTNISNKVKQIASLRALHWLHQADGTSKRRHGHKAPWTQSKRRYGHKAYGDMRRSETIPQTRVQKASKTKGRSRQHLQFHLGAYVRQRREQAEEGNGGLKT